MFDWDKCEVSLFISLIKFKVDLIPSKCRPNKRYMIEQKSGYMLSVSKNDEGHKLFYTLYQPQDASSIKATLLICHGMQEHSGRYVELARFLAENGFVVLTYDHLGHGKTAQTKEDLGFFTAENPREQVVMDAENMADYLEHKFPFVPHFLLGHSMGSFIARCFLQIAPQRFDGAVIVGTGGKIAGIGLAKGLLNLLNAINPRKRSRFINLTFAKMNNARFKGEVQQYYTNWLSVNKENRTNFLNDPLCGKMFTNNGFKTLIELNMDATKTNWHQPLLKKFPMYFISGEQDPIGDFGKGIKKTVDDLKTNGFQNITMKLYTNMRHEIFFEEDKIMVFDDIRDWLNEQLNPSK